MERCSRGQYEIFVRSFPGPGGTWQISTAGGREPVFSPKGGELFYRNARHMTAVTYTTNGESFAAGKPSVLFSGDFVETFAGRNYDVSRDGQRFLTLVPSGSEDSPSVVLVQNWFEELKRLAPTP